MHRDFSMPPEMALVMVGLVVLLGILAGVAYLGDFIREALRSLGAGGLP